MTESDRSMDVIGHTFNLERRVVTLSRRNFFETMYSFFAADSAGPVTVGTMGTLAALASRYSVIRREMRPFSKVLRDGVGGVTNRHAVLRLREGAVRSVDRWRAMPCTLALDETRFARPVSTFVPKASMSVVQFDVSLEGAGGMAYERDPTSGVKSLYRLKFSGHE